MGERIAILGMGVSGRAVADLAQVQGDAVLTFDENATADRADLTRADLAEVDRIVISPGLAAKHPWRRSALASGKPCQGEIGYAAERWRGKIYGVTGTNGKTSLTQLLTAALCASGVEAVACGNIGMPLASIAATPANTPEAVAVCELSSFQAELSEGLQLDALVWTNFAPDHLDRYENLKEYFMAKWSLTTRLKPGAPFVCGAELGAFIEQFGFKAAGKISDIEAMDPAGLPDHSAFLRSPQKANLALAQSLWEALDADAAALRGAAAEFKVPAHRLQIVATLDGVTCWNDSKATNFHAVGAALDAMPEGAVVWVGGGRAKGEDPAKLVEYLKGRVTQACVYGECAPLLCGVLEDSELSVYHAADCEDAIREAVRLARKNSPAHLLFSPGFASFDAFASYAERGKYFNSVVLSL